MKHLYEYALEYILESKKNDEEISDETLKHVYKFLSRLADKDSLGDYVKQLNAMLEDKDAKQILIKAFGKAKHGYKFDGAFKNIPVKDLHPTQSEIDVNKSIGYPFKNAETAKLNGEKYYGSKPVVMPFPLITFDGKYILDGHHRWSQVFAFNPDAKMECLDIKLAKDSDIKKLSPNDALKICQGVLAAKRAQDGKGKIPQSKVEGANVFNMSEEDIKNKVNEYINKDQKSKEAAEELKKCANLDSVDEFKDLIAKNLLKLQEDNKKYSDAGNPRGDMPQTDKGGDDPEKQETARPEKPGSALNTFIKGTVSDKVLKK